MPQPVNVGFLLFPQVTQLDFTGPLQVLSRLPGARIHLVWKRIEPVPSDTVLMLHPTVTFADCPQLDVICVPGGFGTDALMDDQETLDFLRRQAAGARYVTSVCTGALVLGAAGLLQGYRATTYWAAVDNLSSFGAMPVRTRVCVDRDRITGGGVTAGIDFGLTVAAVLSDQKTAESIQLMLEYNPQPPFNAGSPDTAPADVLAMLREKMAPSVARRRESSRRAAARLGLSKEPSAAE
ncbi:MAG: DJ-1/PfpI family protein [Xanthobacteraceae bacterium]|nr:DJ-1/PfpI family protein [Xanthobacteraceae bacterium]